MDSLSPFLQDSFIPYFMPVYPGALERSTRMRWTEQMAEAIVPRRAVYLSGDFDQYWQFHIDEDSKTPIFLRLERRSKVATPN